MKMKTRILALTNVVSPTGENMALGNAPESVLTVIYDVITVQPDTESFTLHGFVAVNGKNWRWEY